MRFISINTDIIKIPQKMWFTVRECCELKGINIRTAYNKPSLLPDAKYEERIAGRRVFRRDGVAEWLSQTDRDVICVPSKYNTENNR